MATTSQIPEQAASSPGRISPIVAFQRAEGLVIAAVTAVLYARAGTSWWLFAALWLVPDLSMLGYLGRPCRAARIYNTFHTYLLPGVLALTGLLIHASNVLPVALIWANHIGVDRALGYGLKYSDGFQWTHLGRIGRQRA
jgi:hypothetical protein